MRGVSFPKWEPRGVPRITDKHLENVFYLYPTVEDAKAGRSAGGTGFCVTIDSAVAPGMGYNYAVTNYHVAIGLKGRGAPVIRINTLDGGHDIFELGPEDWIFDPVIGADVVVAPIKTDEKVHVLPLCPLNSFATRAVVKELDIGPGDNVFMVGRFVDHDGGQTNRPAARFGHISMMPSPLIQEHSQKLVDAYCVDMNSRTGYSGSPVWAYRTPGGNLQKADYTKMKAVTTGDTFMLLLGIHYGQFPEFWRIEDGQVIAHEQEPEAPAVGSNKQIRGMSGMTCVLPVWHITHLLNKPTLKRMREAEELRLAAELNKSGRNRPTPESAA